MSMNDASESLNAAEITDREIDKIIARRQNSPIRYVEADEARAASSRIFEENTELFKKLAQ